MFHEDEDRDGAHSDTIDAIAGARVDSEQPSSASSPVEGASAESGSNASTQDSTDQTLVSSRLARVIDSHIDGLKRETPYNITVDGHRTSVRLEPYMWDSLQDICLLEGIDVHTLCTHISNRHLGRRNLTSAIRVFVMAYYRHVALEHGLLPRPASTARTSGGKGLREDNAEDDPPPGERILDDVLVDFERQVQVWNERAAKNPAPSGTELDILELEDE